MRVKVAERNERKTTNTPNILRSIKAVWESLTSDLDVEMLWAACCVAFFGFLRVGEMTLPSNGSYDAAVHLSLGDIAMDNPAISSSCKSVHQAVQDRPVLPGSEPISGKTRSDLCPVAAFLNYLVVRGPTPGAMFCFEDSCLLTRQCFVEAVKVYIMLEWRSQGTTATASE